MRDRRLVWDGCVNVRDLGGLTTEDGATTRFGAVVRADNVCLLGSDGWRALIHYGVRRIVDLRHEHERDADPPHADGVEIVHAPLVEDPARFVELDELLAGISDPPAWRRENYLTVLDWFPANFARAIVAVARAPNGAVLVHCAGGVDRTGLVSALLLRVAGVGVETVAQDYAASELNWAPFIDEWLAEAPDDKERAKRRLLSVMPAAAMRDVLVELERRHGSVRGYLLAAGASERDLERVRSRLRD
jgi:protein tyrosine/serine phosphatase